MEEVSLALCDNPRILRVLAIVARLVAPAGSELTVVDIENAARSAAEWFVELHQLPRAKMSAELDARVRDCGTDNHCVAAALEEQAIDRVLYVVVNVETGFATAEVLGRSAGTPLATEAIAIEGSAGAAVNAAVTRALIAAGEQKGARLVLDVAPVTAIVRVSRGASSSTVAAGEAIFLPAGTQKIEANAPGSLESCLALVSPPGLRRRKSKAHAKRGA